MELLNKTIGEILNENAEKYSAQDAVVYADQNTRYSWLRLKTIADRITKSFISLGIKKGDHVAIWGTNKPQWFLTQLATAKIGAALVTINPEWKAAEMEYAIKQSDSKILVMTEGFEKTSGNKTHRYDYIKILLDACPELNSAQSRALNLEKFPVLKNIILITDKPAPKWALSWKEFYAAGFRITAATLKNAESLVHKNDICLIQYTSGTTGFPKGAMLTHYNVVNNALEGSRNMELTNTDRLCGPVPYYHCFGSILVNLCCLTVGATIVIPAEHFNPRKTLMAVEQEKCTALHGVPTMFIAQLADPEFSKFNLSSLRTGIMAGAPCPIELMKDVVHKMGAKKITIVYGLTEASPITHQTRPNDSIERRVSTVGKPINNTEAIVVDVAEWETNRKIIEVVNGEIGEIWARGYNIMAGYYKKPEETAKAIVADRWLRTGDLGIKDSDGYYKIAGRLKEMFIVGGHNVYPAEVQQKILSLFEEIEIVEVVGIPHQTLQEICAAIIKLKDGKSLTYEQIKEKCETNMEWSSIPKHVKFVNDFSPFMTVTGKMQKFKMKEVLIAELGLQELIKIKTA